jgi:hypothetical protein
MTVTVAALRFAVITGHFPIVQWFESIGVEWPRGTTSWAAKKGDLVMLKYLRGIGCRYTAFVTRQAAKHGHLEMLIWLVANKCPYISADLWHFAKNKSQYHIMIWLRDNQFPNSPNCRWYNPLAPGELELLQWSEAIEEITVLALEPNNFIVKPKTHVHRHV